jgi:hypothetical protein
MLLSLTMARTGSFNTFLVVTGTSVLVGSLLLLMLRRAPEEDVLGEPVAA